MNLVIGAQISFTDSVKYELEKHFSYEYKNVLYILWWRCLIRRNDDGITFTIVYIFNDGNDGFAENEKSIPDLVDQLML
jgi:hypothetical protein